MVLKKRTCGSVLRYLPGTGGTENESNKPAKTDLRRRLGVYDIAMLGVGHMLGSGLYILIAIAAKDKAGPAISLSLLIAGLFSYCNARGYVEMNVRYPRAGSAYAYIYCAHGEELAFLVGWITILAYSTATAAVAKGGIAFIDSLTSMETANNMTAGLDGVMSEPYGGSGHLKMFAGALVLTSVVFSSISLQSKVFVNRVLTGVNLAYIALVIGAGAYFSGATNWKLFSLLNYHHWIHIDYSMISRMGFFCYLGLDSIFSAAEEAEESKYPVKFISFATLVAMTIAMVAHCGVSAALTLVVKYSNLTGASGMADEFEEHGAAWVKRVVVACAMCGLSSSIIGSLFVLTKTTCKMADDGLFFSMSSSVNSKAKVHLVTFSAISILMALTVDLETLVELATIGVLFVYSLVNLSALLLRKPELGVRLTIFTCVVSWFFRQLIFTRHQIFGYWALSSNALKLILLIADFGSLYLICCHTAIDYPDEIQGYSEAPAVSIYWNIMLLVRLKSETWTRFLVYVILGIFLYLGCFARRDRPGKKTDGPPHMVARPRGADRGRK